MLRPADLHIVSPLVFFFFFHSAEQQEREKLSYKAEHVRYWNLFNKNQPAV